MNTSGVSGVGNSLSVNLTNLDATVPNSQQTNPFESLNLTTQQQQQLGQILQSAKSEGLSPSQLQSQINAILTPAQQQQLNNQISEHRHRRDESTSSSSVSQNDQTDAAFGIPTSGSTNSTQTISDIAATFWAQSQQQNNT